MDEQGRKREAEQLIKHEEELARKRRRTDVEATPERAAPIAGRNDPCPCGSGKKFKKCCGAAGGSSAVH
jgi:uncharacterized protein YecA (UPF0149 family)